MSEKNDAGGLRGRVKHRGQKMNDLLKSLEPVNSDVGRSGNFHSKNRRKMLGFLENWLTNLTRRAWFVMSEAEEKMNAIVLVAGDDNQRHLRAVSVYLTCAQFLDSGGVEKEKGEEAEEIIEKVVDGYLWFVREYRFEETGGTFLELWRKFAYRGVEDATVRTPPGVTSTPTHSPLRVSPGTSPVVGFRADGFYPVVNEGPKKPTGVRDILNADVRFPVWLIIAGIVIVVVVLYH